ncbi:toxin C-terminal domain-containing protein [Leifsonia sp. 21MFCrub1.1]|uniref:toxin C-terminal domain-containing protein n=1 Tax=Leifsonia sp. 21MFCrub1.1 TaxID=1798223 RepID=UPI00089285C2|nr:toxin C-terminal domain-containing protein [Leifsonia sp. 21MFCrub1.1]SEA34004.1 RHS repeat-associated core domain-containing protein [Leifsonia sp. 21MFCrub1.1]
MGGIPAETFYYSYDSNNNFTGADGLDTYGIAGYTAINQLSEINRPGSTTLYTDFGYDPATTALIGVKDTTQTGSTFTTQANRQYTRNNAGDVTGIATTGAAGTDTQCFGYDYLHDLTQAWTPANNDCSAAPSAGNIGGAAPYWTSYAIDPATGNRTQVTHNPTNPAASATTDTYAYPAAGSSHPHAVQTITRSAGTGTTDTYGYDASGNTTTRPGQTLTFDANGKLSTVSAGGATQTSVYDASGALLLQTDPTNGTTLYIGDTELRVAPGSSTASAVRTYAIGGTPVAERTTKAGVAGSVLLWISGDANHTQDLEVNSNNGAITRRYADPYGNSRGAAATWSSNHGYLDATESPFSNLTQLGARGYDSATGRFVSLDGILAPNNPGQSNGYAYSANNPVTTNDPTGDCYQTNSDSLNFHTNCVGSRGSAAGNGPSYVKHQGSPSSGNSSADYGTYHSATKWTGSTKLLPPPVPDSQVLGCGPGGCITAGQYRSGSPDNLRDQEAAAYTAIAATVFAEGALEFCAEHLELPACQGGEESLTNADESLMEQIAEDEAIAEEDEAEGLESSYSGAVCGGQSFSADTKVLMSDGSQRSIDNLEAGDQVLALDTTSGSRVSERVGAVLVRNEGGLVDLMVSSTGGDAVIHTTAKHPVWVPSEHKWIDAGLLQVGESVQAADGSQVTVSRVLRVAGVKPMWDLTVSTTHDFYVGAGESSVLVHNCPAADGVERLTSPQQKALAKLNGWQQTNRTSNGQPIFKVGKNYVSYDVDGHNGGVWKMARTPEALASKSTRMGTYDSNLNRIGD